MERGAAGTGDKRTRKQNKLGNRSLYTTTAEGTTKHNKNQLGNYFGNSGGV